VLTHNSYDYAVVRVVPRVERGEFVNAGVIVSCAEQGSLQAAIELDESPGAPMSDETMARWRLGGTGRLCSCWMNTGS